MKYIYVIRHCEAEGQPVESPLTERGVKQALEVSHFFSEKPIDRIISSPFKRAIETIQPLAHKLHINIEKNSQLSERVLSTKNLPDWLDKLRATFDDSDMKFEGGESSNDAKNRIAKVVEEAFRSKHGNTIIVTHGNLMSLLLNYYDKNFGFEDWKRLSNPDIFLLRSEADKVSFERVWKQQ